MSQTTTPSGAGILEVLGRRAAECRTEATIAAKNPERAHVATGWLESEAETIAARTAVAALIARNAELEAERDALIDQRDAMVPKLLDANDRADALAADNLAMRDALGNLIGDPTDPNIGWRGRSSGIDMFACEHCRAEHLDCTMIPHSAECPVPPAIALARTPAKENDDG